MVLSFFPSIFLAQFPEWNTAKNNLPAAPLTDFEVVFTRLTNALLLVIGASSLIMLIVGGIRLITSGGDEKALEGAKKTITYAIAGLVLTVLAWIIINFFATFFGVPELRQFKLVP